STAKGRFRHFPYFTRTAPLSLAGLFSSSPDCIVFKQQKAQDAICWRTGLTGDAASSTAACALFAPRSRQDAQRGGDRHLVLGQIGGGRGGIEHFLENNADLDLLGRQIVLPCAVRDVDILGSEFVILGAHFCLGRKEKKCLLCLS
ncbi:MAG: hypothetical protein RSD99_21455, partial [Janthinobacterium sp.]